MKVLKLLALAVLCAAPAEAGNRIELYGTHDRTSCFISEPVSPPIVQIHVFLAGDFNATGVRFTAPKPSCWVGATWLGDALRSGLAAGQSQGDWSIGFGKCVDTSAPYYIGAISYLISNQALACCEYDALPSVQFAWTDCEFVEYDLEESKSALINPDESCGCQAGTTLAIESTTWGKVKSLYR